MLVFEERGKPEYPEKNLSEQSREPTNSAHIDMAGGTYFEYLTVQEKRKKISPLGDDRL